MIVTDLQPVSIVEDTGFKKLLNILDPKYTTPSRRIVPALINVHTIVQLYNML